jgi:hypothetical protein
VERGRRAEGGGGAESGGRTEGSPGSREGGTGSSGGGGPAAAEEQRQLLATGLSGLKLTIPAPASIACMASGSLTQSKGKRKATEEEPSVSQYVLFFIFCASLILSVGRGFPCAICAQSPVSPV